ncbi:MAG TPA: metallophosphoesterase [Afifellaceae bacterium]|nr:metallophosphoesterase [Afifellaceae bacterium]
MIRIAHLSDVHLNAVPAPELTQLLSKRMIGYVNWRRNRAHLMTSASLDRLVADMKAQQPDHIVVTGDLTNVALPGEFANATAWLQSLGDGDRVTAIPGNHDAYVPRADRIYRRLWAPWMSDHRIREDPGDATEDAVAHFPFLREFGQIAMIGVSTAVPSAPFMATGRIGRRQSENVRKLLQEAGEEGFFRIVLIHHPPKLIDFRRAHRRLTDARRLRAAVRSDGAELVLHGHDHIQSMTAIEGPTAPVPVVGVPAAGGPATDGPKAGGYALHDIEQTADGYALTVTQRGYDAEGEIVDKVKSGFSLTR